nr:copper resistance protein B [uncultured Sphingomonas sp.]
MTRALLLIIAAALGTPAYAQHSGHAVPTAPTPSTACSPEHAAMGHCTLPMPATTPAAPTCSAEHAAMGHCKMPSAAAQAPTPPKAPSCPPEHAAMGHCKADMATPPATGPSDPHAGHDMGAMAAPEIPIGRAPPAALAGPANAADAYWGKDQMAPSRRMLTQEHGSMPAQRLLVDRAETRARQSRDAYLLDMQAWYGGDINRLWLKSEIEGAWGRKVEHAEVQALVSHAIGPWFDLQGGVRFDPQPGPNRTHLALGVQGLAPYWWDVEATAFLSNKGDVTARAEAEYDLRITQKLILQPRAELDLSLQDVPELAIGSGLTNAALGLRLRYQISPLVAPYIGIEYERAFGRTRKFLRAGNEDAGGLNLLAGVRFWL